MLHLLKPNPAQVVGQSQSGVAWQGPWQYEAPLPVAVTDVACAALDNKVYVVSASGYSLPPEEIEAGEGSESIKYVEGLQDFVTTDLLLQVLGRMVVGKHCGVWIILMLCVIWGGGWVGEWLFFAPIFCSNFLL